MEKPRIDGYYYSKRTMQSSDDPISILFFYPRNQVAIGPLSPSMYAGSKSPSSKRVREILREISEVLITLIPEPLRNKTYQYLWDLFILGQYWFNPDKEIIINNRQEPYRGLNCKDIILTFPFMKLGAGLQLKKWNTGVMV